MSVITKLRKGRDGAPPTEEPAAEAPLSAMDRRVRRPLVSVGGVLVALVVTASLGAGAYAYVRYGLSRSLTVPAERVTVETVRTAPFSDYAPVTGNVAPEDTVYLDVIDGGQVTEVLAEEGARVEAGELLARMKNTRLELEVLGREAQITEQQNNLATMRLAFEQNDLRHQRDLMMLQLQIEQLTDRLDRRRPLRDSVASGAEIDDIETELRYTRAQKELVAQAQSADAEMADRTLAELERSIGRMTDSLALVQDSLGDLSLAAPIAGQLTIFEAKVGAVIAPGQRIGQIDTVDAFKVTALVDEFYLGRIAVGQSASVEIGRATYPLEVVKVYPSVRDRQFEVDLAFLGETPGGLRRGQTVRPRIELGETEESLVIANGPYYDETGGLWVLVVSPDGSTATRRDVRLGRRNPEVVEVLSGLAEGERVITSSYETFKDIERIDFN